jgi:hypothetical protein
MIMEVKEAFTTMFGFDLFDFEEAYANSYMGSLFDSLEEARKMKSAYECLKEKFGWKENFSIYKYNYCIRVMYAVEKDDFFESSGLEKVEKIE